MDSRLRKLNNAYFNIQSGAIVYIYKSDNYELNKASKLEKNLLISFLKKYSKLKQFDGDIEIVH